MAFPNIFVGGLTWETTKDDLRRYFQRFGEVVDAYIISGSSRGESKGFGFVRFKDEDSAARALENPNPIINGKMANCEHAKNNQPKENVSMAFAKIFVGCLSLETTSDDLRRYFQRFGDVVEANVVSQSSGRSEGYGFVTFRDAESATRALEIKNHFINGKMTYCKAYRTDYQPKQKGNSSNQAGPSQQYQPNSSRPINMPHQYQPTPQYYPPWFWNPVSGQYYYLCYNNPFYSYPTPMLYNQNMMQQNDETDQGNTVIVDNADKITIVECDDDGDEEDGNIKQFDADTTKELDNEDVEEEEEDKP